MTLHLFLKSILARNYVKSIAIGLIACLTVTGTASAAATCETIIDQAYKQLDTLCSTIGRNQACYGNDAVRSEFNPPYKPDIFLKEGDKAPVAAIRELYTLPMDVQSQTWGLSMMKVQTNLPDTAPGQNVVFVLYGDVHLSNADDEGKMSAFYFTSGLGQPVCKNAPADGIMIRSPKGMRVQFNANGVNIDIGSTVVLQAVRNQQLTVQLLEGSANVTADNRTMSLTPGQSVAVPLGGIDGLQAVGEPSAPFQRPVNAAQQRFLNMAPRIWGVVTSPAKPAAPVPAQNNNNGGNKAPKPAKGNNGNHYGHDHHWHGWHWGNH